MTLRLCFAIAFRPKSCSSHQIDGFSIGTIFSGYGYVSCVCAHEHEHGYIIYPNEIHLFGGIVFRCAPKSNRYIEIRWFRMVFHSVVHILSLTRVRIAYPCLHIPSTVYTVMVAIAKQFPISTTSRLFLLVRKYHKSNYRLDWFYETFGWVSPVVDHGSRTMKSRVEMNPYSQPPTLTHTHTSKMIWREENMRYGRPLAVVLMLSPSTKSPPSMLQQSHYYIIVSVELNRGLFIFLEKKQSQFTVWFTGDPHKIRIKIHFDFDWIHIFHSNPIVPIRYRRFLFVVYPSVSLCVLCVLHITFMGNGY